VLSVQSHVVSGYVGNKAATLPLQLAGFDVDAVPTVSFSNHTGYGCVKGTRLAPDGLADLVAGLDANGLLSGYDFILTGYIGSAPLVAAVAAGAVLSLGVGLVFRLENLILAVPVAILAAGLSYRRKLGAPALIGLGAAAGFFFVR
jgi:hypothetical protein